MDLPHNFWIGLASWFIGIAVGIRIFWIVPWWADKLSPGIKSAIIFITVFGFVVMVWQPVKSAYIKRQPNTVEIVQCGPR